MSCFMLGKVSFEAPFYFSSHLPQRLSLLSAPIFLPWVRTLAVLRTVLSVLVWGRPLGSPFGRLTRPLRRSLWGGDFTVQSTFRSTQKIPKKRHIHLTISPLKPHGKQTNLRSTAESPQGWAFWSKIFRPSRPSYEGGDSIPYRGALGDPDQDPRVHPMRGDFAAWLYL